MSDAVELNVASNEQLWDGLMDVESLAVTHLFASACHIDSAVLRGMSTLPRLKYLILTECVVSIRDRHPCRFASLSDFYIRGGQVHHLTLEDVHAASPIDLRVEADTIGHITIPSCLAIRSLLVKSPAPTGPITFEPGVHIPAIELDLPTLGQVMKHPAFLDGVEVLKLKAQDIQAVHWDTRLFTRLSDLTIRLSGLTAVPQALLSDALVHLDLDHNAIPQFPLELLDLPALKELSLMHNQISRIPAEISRLPHLKTLRLAVNPISSLPSELYDMHLDEINLRGTDLSKDVARRFKHVHTVKF